MHEDYSRRLPGFRSTLTAAQLLSRWRQELHTRQSV